MRQPLTDEKFDRYDLSILINSVTSNKKLRPTLKYLSVVLIKRHNENLNSGSSDEEKYGGAEPCSTIYRE